MKYAERRIVIDLYVVENGSITLVIGNLLCYYFHNRISLTIVIKNETVSNSRNCVPLSVINYDNDFYYIEELTRVQCMGLFKMLPRLEA